jgi:hypothetical protein
MRFAREVWASLKFWFQNADDELDLKSYASAATIGTLMEAPVLYGAGLPTMEIVYTVGMSLSGALGLCMLVELWLHYRS